MKKLRLLAWLITLTMLCELLPLGTFAQSDIGQSLAQAVAQNLEEENSKAVAAGKCGDNLTWSLSNDGTLTMSGTGDMYDYSSDSSSVLHTPWSKYLNDIKNLVVNDGATHIGKLAFANCSNLYSVVLPDTVSSIGEQAFTFCSSLVSINIPDAVDSISYQTFFGCKSLDAIVLPASISSIAPYAFDGCSSLASIVLPGSIVTIGRGAFTNCTSLASISIPLSVSSIEYAAFSSCSALKDVYYVGSEDQWNTISIGDKNDPLLNAAIHYKSSQSDIGISDSGVCGDNLTWVLSSDGTLTISGTGDMYDYNGVAPYNISPWYHNTDIKKLVINNGVSSIGDYALLGCYKISSISLPESLERIGYNALDPCSGLTEIDLPKNLTKLGGYSLASGSFSSIKIPDGISSIELYTFSNCKNLQNVDLPDDLTTINEGAFNHCESLTSIHIPQKVTDIKKYAFWYCSSLTNLELPSGISKINEGTFDSCAALSSISIPSTVTTIEKSAFYGCLSLKDVYFSGTESEWNAISIDSYQNDALRSAVIHCSDFTFGRDNPSFLNQAKYFFQGSELNYWNQKYNSGRPISFTDRFFHHFNQYASIHLSQEKFNQLTKNLSPAALQWFKLKMRSGDLWGGSCYGMVLVSAIHYMDPDRLSYAQLASTGLAADSATYSLPAPVDNSDVEDLINYYYASQLLPTQYKILSNCLYNCANDYDGVLNEIVTSLSHGIPVIASLSNHEIMLLHVKAELDDHYVLGIYDPNEATEQTLLLYKSPYIDADGDGYLNINYKDNQTQLQSYTLASDLDYIDVRNYFNPSIDHETATDYNDAHITIQAGGSVNVVHGGQYYYRAENGKLIEKSPDVHLFYPSNVSDENPSNDSVDLIFPKPSTTEDVKLVLSSDGVNDASMILNNSTLAVSASGPVELIYNEQTQTVDLTAAEPTDISLMVTQNDTSSTWPWHSWALDTAGTTEFHAELKDDGLHLSGDGIANAQYATENADTDIVDSGTIPAKATDVTIVKKDGNNQQTEIKDNTQTKPTDPDKLTVTVVDGKITAIDDVPIADDTTVLDNVAAETKITITADDKSADGKTFREWVVTPADSVTLSDASSSTASFTMGAVSVTIKAQYDSTTPTPTPTPGGGDSGSGGGGAAVILGLGAAAAITAGIVLTMPVDVQGRVELANHAAVPGAKVSLLQNGNVVTQTTADESGHFSLKAKRGDYELTVVYTDANGQFVQKTSRIKAPTKDFVVTF